ncbi:MAG: MBL fold metallo-hydrolase [Syntrophomonadaceae bacterium]
MMEKIRRNILRIEIPLPRNPLKALNAYFLAGDDRNLLIDTGFNQAECRQAMDQAMEEIGFSMENTDIFITHCHSDHAGLAGYLAKPETRIYTGDYTARDISRQFDWFEDFGILVQQGGLLDMDLDQNPINHPGYRYRTDKVDFNQVTVVADGTIINVGDYSLKCVHTTGHAPDHICLYEENHKILFCGDHILETITPNNNIWETPWDIKVDYLDEYLKSLTKVEALAIDLILPAHRGHGFDCYRRIQELREHHERRLNNVLDILGNKTMTAAQVASKMDWDLDIKDWDQYPKAQKIFATGEALSHLSHLVCKGVLRKELRDGVVYYFR